MTREVEAVLFGVGSLSMLAVAFVLGMAWMHLLYRWDRR